MNIEPLESRIAPANAAVIELTALTGADGFQINGEAAGDTSGRSLSAAGDVNGDGIGDLIIGADTASPNGAQSGAAYVIFGTLASFPANLNLSALTGANGFQINGEAAGDNAGRSVSAAGDVNGDGFDDIVIGAPGADPNARSGSGTTYIVFGAASFSATLNLSSLNGGNGFKVFGAAVDDACGIAVATAGDVNGDGFDDVIIGADHAAGSAANTGASYVVFGHAGAFGATLDVTALAGTNGFKISGVATGNSFGHSVSLAGDVNGDGFDDVIIGAFHATGDVADSGASYIVFGHSGPFGANLNASALDGTNGFKLSGVAAGDYAGYSATGAHDVNGDGFDDVVIGAVFADPNGLKSGTSYVVFGKAGGFTGNLDLATLDGNIGFNVNGAATLDFVGTSVSGAGDVNGDGFDDLHLGANGLDTHGIYTGGSYVVFGRAKFDTNVNVSTLDGSNGFQVIGEAAGHFAGSSVSAAGDVNGDGLADVFIASRFANSSTGECHVVFGAHTSVDATISANHKSATFTDIDGDLVTVKTSLGDLTGKISLFAFRGGARLDTLDLRDAQFDGAKISITAKKSKNGDGLVNVARIDATDRDLGSVTVKGDLAVIDCGDGDYTDPALKLLSVRSMGRYGLATGAPDLNSDINGTLVALQVTGDIIGATILASAGLNGKIGSAIIGGSLIGGVGSGATGIATTGDMGTVKIGRDFLGGIAENGGIISSQGKLAGVTIGGSLVGGAGEASARIFSVGDMGRVKIGHDVIGGAGGLSGSIDCLGKVTSVTIGGSLLGAAGSYYYTDTSGIAHEGQLFSVGLIGSVKVGQDVIDGTGFASGEIRSYDGLAAVTIGGSLIGGTGFAGGHIATGIFDHPGNMGPVKIGGDVIGGTSAYTGHIESFGTLASVTIGGSLIGGTTVSGMGPNFQTGAITSLDDMGAIKIGGDVRGGSISGIQPELQNSGYIEGDRIASVFVGGSIITGIDNSTGGNLFNSAAIRANDDIGAIVVKGGLIGHTTENGSSLVIISARGQETLATGATTDIAIKSLKIGGRVELATIRAGFGLFNPDSIGTNGNASIGAVKVGGDWIASSLTAGIEDGGASGFGTPGDRIASITGNPLIARIASIAIKGVVIGSDVADDHFGFIAQQIGAFKSLGFIAPLTTAIDAPIELSLTTGDVTIREV